MEHWYVARGKATKGPYTRAQLQSLAHKGVLRASDMLRMHGTQRWVAAHEVFDLRPSTAAVQAAPAPGALPAGPASPTPAPARPPTPPPVPVSAAATALGVVRRRWLWIGVASTGLCTLVIIAVSFRHQKPEVRAAGDAPLPNHEPEVRAANDLTVPNPRPEVRTEGDKPVSAPKSKIPAARDGASPHPKPEARTKSAKPPPNSRRGGLTESDITLLKLASIWHYVNGTRISGSLAAYAEHADLIEREAVKPGASGRLARLVLANYLIALKQANLSTRRRDLLQKRLPVEILKLAARGALAGLRNEDIPPPFSEEFREGWAKSGQNWVDNLRLNEIGKWSVMVLNTQANVNVASTFETDYAPRMGRQRLGWDRMTVAARKVDRHSYSVGNFVEVTYQGREPLTDVVFVTRLKTTGADTTFTPGQLNVMRINEVTGFGDKNKDIGNLFRLQNLVHSMPKAGVVFVPVLKPGDTVQLTYGMADKKYLRGGSVTVYSRQGRLAEKDIPFG